MEMFVFEYIRRLNVNRCAANLLSSDYVIRFFCNFVYIICVFTQLFVVYWHLRVLIYTLSCVNMVGTFC